MRDPSFRARVLAEEPDPAQAALRRRLLRMETLFPLGDVPDYEPPRERSLGSIARREGRSAAEVAYDMLLEDGGRSFFFAPFANYAAYDLDVCREMLAHPNTVPGLGDGGAHVGVISDASFPT